MAILDPLQRCNIFTGVLALRYKQGYGARLQAFMTYRGINVALVRWAFCLNMKLFIILYKLTVCY